MNAHAPIEAIAAERFEIVDSDQRLAAIEPAWTAPASSSRATPGSKPGGAPYPAASGASCASG